MVLVAIKCKLVHCMHMHMLSAVHMVSANTWSEVLTHGPGSNKVYIGSLHAHAHAQCSAHGQC